MLRDFENYLKNVRKYSLNTINSYISDINIFLEYLHIQKLNYKDVNHEVIRSYLKYLDEKKYKNSSINRILSSLNDYYNYSERKNDDSQTFYLKRNQLPRPGRRCGDH